MAQEFTIKSDAIEDKINQLLPSQAGFGAGVDFSASTMVIPIVDLTETAEGSGVRQDLQTALSHSTATVFDVTNTTSTIINTTGYFRIIGTATTGNNYGELGIILSDGTTDKLIWNFENPATSVTYFFSEKFDYIVFLKAGDSLKVKSSNAFAQIAGSVRQIADISGNLVNP
jgi:hypothetical protein